MNEVSNMDDLKDIKGIGSVYANRLKENKEMPVNNVYDLLLVLTNFNDEFTFKQWLKDTCQMRRDCLENCYQDLQSRLRDPTVRKELNRRTPPNKNASNTIHEDGLNLEDIQGIGPEYSHRLKKNGKLNDSIDLMLIMIDLRDKDSFIEWMKDTCQMRRDCLENCYQDLRSRLQDPTVRKELNSRRKNSPNITRHQKSHHTNFNSTETTTSSGSPENNCDDNFLDLLSVPGIGKETAFRLQENAVYDKLDLLIKYCTVRADVVSRRSGQHKGTPLSLKEKNTIKETYKIWYYKNCQMNNRKDLFGKCYRHISKLARNPKFLQRLQTMRKILIQEKSELFAAFFQNKLDRNELDADEQLQELNATLCLSVQTLLNDIAVCWAKIRQNGIRKNPLISSASSIDQVKKSTPSNCLQVNLRHSKKAWNKLVDKLNKSPMGSKARIVFIQEPYVTVTKRYPTSSYTVAGKDVFYIRFFPLPRDYEIVHNLYLADNLNPSDSMFNANAVYFGAAILVHKDVAFKRVLPLPKFPALIVGIELIRDGSHLYSIYARPSESLPLILNHFVEASRNKLHHIVVGADLNATHLDWTPANKANKRYESRGKELKSICNNSLKIVNEKPCEKSNQEQGPLRNWNSYHYVDVTLKGDSMNVTNWCILNEKTSSDHPYITFKVETLARTATTNILPVVGLPDIAKNEKIVKLPKREL